MQLHDKETLTRIPVTREANLSRVKEAVKMSSKVRRGPTNGDQRGVKRNAACCDGTARCHIDRIREKGRQRGPGSFFTLIWGLEEPVGRFT